MMSNQPKIHDNQSEYKRPTSRSASNISRRRKPKYRLIPLIILGIIIYVALVLVLGLILGSVAYFAKFNLENAIIVPFIIFQISLFISGLFVSILTRGKTIIPTFFMTVILLAFSFYMSENITTKGILLKTAISLAVLLITFMIAKGTEKKKKRRQYQKRRMS